MLSYLLIIFLVNSKILCHKYKNYLACDDVYMYISQDLEYNFKIFFNKTYNVDSFQNFWSCYYELPRYYQHH